MDLNLPPRIPNFFSDLSFFYECEVLAEKFQLFYAIFIGTSTSKRYVEIETSSNSTGRHGMKLGLPEWDGIMIIATVFLSTFAFYSSFILFNGRRSSDLELFSLFPYDLIDNVSRKKVDLGKVIEVPKP